MKVYYAHSLHLYGKAQEMRDIITLEHLGFEVVNPNAKEHQEVCREIRNDCFENGLSNNVSSERIMQYFTNVVSNCDTLAFRAHLDGKIPGGVGKEIKMAKQNGFPIIELPSILDSRFMSVDESRQYLELLGER